MSNNKKQQAKALLTGGIFISEKNIVAEGYIKSVDTNSAGPYQHYTESEMTFIAFTTNPDLFSVLGKKLYIVQVNDD